MQGDAELGLSKLQALEFSVVGMLLIRARSATLGVSQFRPSYANTRFILSGFSSGAFHQTRNHWRYRPNDHEAAKLFCVVTEICGRRGQSNPGWIAAASHQALRSSHGLRRRQEAAFRRETDIIPFPGRCPRSSRPVACSSLRTDRCKHRIMTAHLPARSTAVAACLIFAVWWACSPTPLICSCLSLRDRRSTGTAPPMMAPDRRTLGGVQRHLCSSPADSGSVRLAAADQPQAFTE